MSWYHEDWLYDVPRSFCKTSYYMYALLLSLHLDIIWDKAQTICETLLESVFREAKKVPPASIIILSSRVLLSFPGDQKTT